MRDIALAEDAGVRLGQVLAALNRGVVLYGAVCELRMPFRDEREWIDA